MHLRLQQIDTPSDVDGGCNLRASVSLKGESYVANNILISFVAGKLWKCLWCQSCGPQVRTRRLATLNIFPHFNV